MEKQVIGLNMLELYAEKEGVDIHHPLLLFDYRLLPIKNRARVPGPAWEPMTAPT